MRAIALVLMLGVLGIAVPGCHSDKRKGTPDSATKAGGNPVAKISVDEAREGEPSRDLSRIPLTREGKTTAAAPKTEPLAKKSADKAPAKEGKPDPGVADPVVGRVPPKKKVEKGPPAGILTAGSFDDNVNPAVFNSFLRKMSQKNGLGDFPTKLQGQRLMVIIKDGGGKPVGNARVRLSAGAGAPVELTTRSDGRAVFMLKLDQLPSDQPLVATVTGPNGGNPVTDTVAAGVARWEITLPGVQAQLPKNLDLAIVLDTTGSMGDELAYLKSEFRGISESIAKKFPEVKQRFSLILYRDEGDEYVVRPFDFTDSLDLFHKRLSAQSAGGGGDYPEAMHRGLEETLQLRWQDKDTARLVFLVGDAPPHAQHMNRTLAAANTLRKKGIAVYPIACSGYDPACELVMRSCAMLTGSQFLFLTDDSGVGGAHAEPSIPYYQVERLEKLMIRMIASELSGQHIPPAAADIIRTVGKKVN
ncbi:MAG: VWA domain-containing protein [Planctomycetes bacterium]|nr:VWA domain-containing protein [Planctomycetota bacterium]